MCKKMENEEVSLRLFSSTNRARFTSSIPFSLCLIPLALELRMTIVSGEDLRNADWAKDTSAFGQKMLLKMGWKQGNGLGKNQQGTNTNLRAIRREVNLGIGAKTDTLGDEGFTVTSRNFHGVLATLHAEHGDSGTSKSSDKKKKKSEKKKSSKEKKGLNRMDSGLTLSSKLVTAGHARKMREAKDLTKKSPEEMAAIFGMKVEQYQSTSVWGRLSTLSSKGDSSDVEEKKEEEISADAKAEKKRKKDKKKRKAKDADDKPKKKKSRKED